ncbi:MAG: hypothetical protein J7619_27300 [Dyadobacter sp.]|uniref:hypothetical protein n=1 Tax=Dyadobacter sp. TaxID=1914288 RepID=UPI001B27A701|nr:hypothetical protein [Dyadobacter sp.]MBO9616427.1 hypothetical protein [Dyadobacter sp.]
MLTLMETWGDAGGSLDLLDINHHLRMNDGSSHLTGLSTHHHLYEKLMEKAKMILISASLSVNEIAFKLGFDATKYGTKLIT